MSDINSITLTGRLTKDAKLVEMEEKEKYVINFSIATNFIKIKNGIQENRADFFNISFWGKGAKKLSTYLLKGQQVGILGKLRQTQFEKEGKKYSKISIIANQITLLESKKQNKEEETEKIETIDYSNEEIDSNFDEHPY